MRSRRARLTTESKRRCSMPCCVREGKSFGQILTVIDKPLHAFLKSRMSIDYVLVESVGGEQRNEADERADPHEDVLAFADEQAVVIEAILFIP